MGFRRVLGVLLSILLAASATAGAKKDVIASGERYSLQASGIEDYRLGVGDKVRLTIFNEPTLSGEFSVAASGELSFPLIGTVDAVGKTPGDVSAKVQAALADGYLRDPRVSLEVIDYRPFFILGEVKAPGQYPYASGLTVFNAVATAQGFTPRAERKQVYIRSSGQSEEQPYRLTPELRVWPGDTIRVGERYF